MALFEIATLGTFAKLLLAARKLAEDTDPLDRLKALADLAENGGKLRAALSDRNLGQLAARIEADCKTADAAYAREAGVGDARNIFNLVAPVALTRCDALAANGLEHPAIVDDMLKAIEASDHARDFRAVVLHETYFRAVMDAALKTMLTNAEFIDGLSPQLWRESLRRQGIAVEILERLEDKVAQQDSKLDALLKHVAASDEALRLSEAGVTEKAVIELARRIVDQVDDLGDAWAELQNAIELAIRVQQEGHYGSNFGVFVDEVLRRVAELSGQGDYDAAAARIDEALADEEAAHRARTLRLLEAGLEQDRLRRNPAAAARRVLRMAEVEASGSLGFEALRAVSNELRDRGREKGLLFDQEVSIDLAQIEIERAAAGCERAAALSDLGISLAELGEREAGTVRLEQAVVAFRAALEELTLDWVPLEWARTQMNLGAALQTLGEREAGTARLEEAVTAYRAALEEWTRERVPLDWATVQMNLGNALQTLGERESGTARLKDAVAAYSAALEELTPDRVPLEWARTQMNLGNALTTLGAREAGTARLEEAVTAYRAALEEWTRERVPLDWATLQFNMGGVELALFDKTGKAARLDAAEAYVRAAREVFEEAGATQYLGMADAQLAEIAGRRE